MLKHRLIYLPFFLAICGVVIWLGGAAIQTVQAANVLPDSVEVSSQAHVVVEYGPADRSVHSVTFTNPISGLVALERTGLEIITIDTAFGTAVCSINGVGCPADDCWCTDKYWGYNYWDGSSWQGYATGADGSVVTNGGVEGWIYGAYPQATLPPAPPLVAAAGGLDYLRPFQSTVNGGFGSNSDSAEMLLTVGANHGLAAAWRAAPGSSSLLQYWFSNSPVYTGIRSENAGKLAVGLASSSNCWPLNSKRPMEYYDPATGAYSTQSGFQAWAMFGVEALGQAVPDLARSYLAGKVQANGAWEWNDGYGTDTNTTALAIQALVGAGEPVSSPIITNGLAYIKSKQNPDGGFVYNPDPHYPSTLLSDANSTSYIVQAIYTVGQDPTSGQWVAGGSDPIEYLLSLQMPDGGFKWQAGDAGANFKATQQVVSALLGAKIPHRQVNLPDCPGGFFPLVVR